MRRPPLLIAAGLLVLCLLPASADAAPPTCDPPPSQTVREGRDTWLYVSFGCRDPDNDVLTFAVADMPGAGTATPASYPGAFVYHPTAGFTGTDSFTFTASDGSSTTPPVAVTVVVTPNQPPVCNASSDEVEPDVVTVLTPVDGGGCSDPDFDALALSIIDQPLHGTVTVAPGAFGDELHYDPSDGYVGPDSFTFRADDGLADTAVVTFSITVLPPNRRPICVPFRAVTMAPGSTLPLDASQTCSDPDGDAFFPSPPISGPDHGRILFGGGVPAYAPDPGFVGIDRIRYVVTDDRGGTSDVALLEITVGNPVGPPMRPPASTAGPPRPAPDRALPIASIRLRPDQRVGAVRKRGLKLTLRSSERATAGLELVADRAVARRLGLARSPRRPVVVGSLQRPVAAGTTALTVALTPKARQALRKVRSVRLRLKGVVTDLSGNRRSLSVRFRLGR